MSCGGEAAADEAGVVGENMYKDFESLPVGGERFASFLLFPLVFSFLCFGMFPVCVHLVVGW